MEISKIAQHWNELYESKADHELGWYEKDASTTLLFLKDLDFENKKIIITGAGKTLLINSLIEKNARLILNDISKNALDKIEIDEKNHLKIEGDLGSDLDKLELPVCDILIDRAVLHFLNRVC